MEGNKDGKDKVKGGSSLAFSLPYFLEKQKPRKTRCPCRGAGKNQNKIVPSDRGRNDRVK